MNSLQRQLRLPILIISAFAISTYEVSGQADKKPVQLPEMIFDPAFYLWLVVVGILVATVLTLSRAIRVLTDVLQGKSKEMEAAEAITEYAPKATIWSALMNRMTRSVPLESEEDVLLHHDYDGIRELDNQLPPWWKWGFYLTIVFAVVYLFGYHLSGTGKLQLEEYQEQLALAEFEKAEIMKNRADRVTAATAVKLTDAVSLSKGQTVFEKNCAACHKMDGGGNVGPNLTDDYWIHGGGMKNIFTVVTDGVPAKGMISWKSQLSPRQIQEVASYVLSLHGTNPPGAKDPQGGIWSDSVTPVDSLGDQAGQVAPVIASR